MEIIDILWRRIDCEGMEACRLSQNKHGWELRGTALTTEDGVVSNLSYRVQHDEHWNTQSSHLVGYSDTKKLDMVIRRDKAGTWQCNNSNLPEITGAHDIDLGFTPSTNTSAIRRLDLDVGESREIVVAWLDTSDWEVKPLTQIYRRKSTSVFEYVSKVSGYRCDLQTDESGLIIRYPDLWSAIGPTPVLHRF